MSYSFHRWAEQDVLEAAQFYRQAGGAKLASRFLDEFARIVAMLVEFPGLGTPVDEVRRVHRLQDFPYSVIYRQEGEGIRILVVRSQYRDPEFGETRL